MKLPSCNKKQAPQINEALSVTIDEADEEMEIVLDDSYEAKPRRSKNDFTIRCLKVTISLLIMFIIVLFGALVRRDAQKSMRPIETGTSSEQSQYFDDQPTSDQEQSEADEDEGLALDHGLLYVSNTSLSSSSSSFLGSNNTAATTTITTAPSPDDKDKYYLDNTTVTTTTTTAEQTSPLAPLATTEGLSEGDNNGNDGIDNDYFRGCLPDRFDNEEMDLTVDPRYNFNRLRPGQFICSKPYRYKPDQPDVVPQRYRFGVTLEGDVVWMDTVVNETVVVFENPGNGDDVSFTLQTDATMVYHHPSAGAPGAQPATLAADYLSHPVSHTPLCLSNHDCPYFHIHQGGVLVLNYIAADGEGWQAKNFLRAYGI